MRATRLSSFPVTLRSIGLRSTPPQTCAPLKRNISNAVPTLPKSPFHRLLARNLNRRPVRHLLSRHFNSNKPPYDPTPHLGSPPSLSLSQRLRKLSREYGWSALGVYLALSALDFPFCFLAVRWVGTERIGHWESVIIEGFWKVISIVYPFDSGPETRSVGLDGVRGAQVEEYGSVNPNRDEVGLPGYDHGVTEAEERNESEDASTSGSFERKPGYEANRGARSMDTAGIGLCHTQKLHLHQSSAYRRRDSQGGESASWMGLGHWETEAKGDKTRLKRLDRRTLGFVLRCLSRYCQLRFPHHSFRSHTAGLPNRLLYSHSNVFF